jgi:hypothetical protein
MNPPADKSPVDSQHWRDHARHMTVRVVLPVLLAADPMSQLAPQGTAAIPAAPFRGM